MTRLMSWMRVAVTDLRGDLRRFGILLACLALGTATIAGVSSVGAALQSAIVRDANTLLGGDLQVRDLAGLARAVQQRGDAQQGGAAPRRGQQSVGQGVEGRLGDLAAVRAHQRGEELLLLAREAGGHPASSGCMSVAGTSRR